MPGTKMRNSGKLAVRVIEDIGLFVILLATVVAAGQEVHHMVLNQTVRLADLLLLFIYLEVVAMVHAYWQSGQLPVRMPLYIGMVALARHLILDIKGMEAAEIWAVAGTILMLGLAVLVIRYGHVRFPYEKSGE